MPQTQRHKVFISYYYEDDEVWKDRFVRIMRGRIVDKSVKVGDIVDHNIPIEDALRRVREEHIAEATVTVVLIGPRTWKRKFVDVGNQCHSAGYRYEPALRPVGHLATLPSRIPVTGTQPAPGTAAIGRQLYGQ